MGLRYFVRVQPFEQITKNQARYVFCFKQKSIVLVKDQFDGFCAL